MFKVQWRTNSGWKHLRGCKREATALNALQSVTDSGTYRVIQGDPNGEFRVVAMRAPAVADDRFAHAA